MPTDPNYTASTVKEIYSLLPSGQLLSDTSGVIVPDATFTITQFTDCDMHAIPSTSDVLEINAMGYGAYCVEYQIQTHGEAHLIALPVKAGHTFDNVQLLMKYTVSNGDLLNIEQSASDALTSTNPILTAVTGIKTVTDALNSMIITAGQAKQFAPDALSAVISQLQPSTASALTAYTAPTLANLPANFALQTIDNQGRVTTSNPGSGSGSGLNDSQVQADVTAALTAQGLAKESNLDALAAAVTGISAATVAAIKSDTVLKQTFLRSQGKYTYNESTHQMTLLNDDGTTDAVVTLTYDPATGVITGKA